MSFLGNLGGGTAIGDALIRIGADTRQMRTEMAAMNAQVKGQMASTGQVIEKQAGGWGKAFTAVKLGVAGIGIGLGLFAVNAIKSAREFDRAMGQVYALTNISKQGIDDLKKATLDLAKVVPQSPKQLAEGLYYIISSGFEAADALKILEVSAKDAAVGMTDTQTVADGLTSAMNAYGVSGQKAAEYSDIMTQTIVQGKAEWADLARAIGAVSVQGATAGVTFKEVSSAIANVTQVGLTAQRGSRNLAFLIRALNAPNNIAAKTFQNLGLKVDENTLKQKGLIGMLEMMSKAAGKHHDVIVKNTKGQIDWDKSLAATQKANKGWAKSMSTMTGGAAGFLVAQILLQNHGAKYTEILKSMDDAQGLTAKSFERMKEADPGMMFDLLKNRVTVAAIEFGTSLMPTLRQFLSWLVVAVPHAFEVIGDVWRKHLQKPVGHMLDAFGKLAGAIGGLFSGGTAQDGDTFAMVLGGIAAALGKIVDYAAAAIDLMATLFGNPVVQAITRVIGAALILKATLGIILGLGGSLDRKFRGLARSLSGGLLFPGSKSGPTGDPALDKSARNLDGSATALKEAASALKGARAEAQVGAGLVRGNLIGGGHLAPVGGAPPVGSAVAMASMEADVGRAAYARANAATKAYMRGLAAPMSAAERLAMERVAYPSGAQVLKNAVSDVAAGIKRTASGAGGGIRSAFGAARSGLSAGLGAVSKVFWPLMVASIATELIKAPLSDLLASSTPWKRAAASMKDDFVGGLINMVKAWKIGSDLFVALPQIDLGGVKIKTENLGNFNLDPAAIEKLTSGGLTGALESQRIGPDVAAALQQRSGELVHDWLARIEETLTQNGIDPGQIKQVYASIIDKAGRYGPGADISPEAIATARSAIQTMVNGLATNVHDSTEKLLSDLVNSTLATMGFDPTQITTIPPEVRQKLAVLFKGGVDGQYSALMLFTAQQALRAAEAIKPNVTAADILKRAQQTPTDAFDRTKRNLPTAGEAANQAFTESLNKNVQPAQTAYREWWAKVASNPDLQMLRDSGQQFIDTWAKDIRAAKTDKAKAALAKKMADAGQGMSYEMAQALLKDSEGATGASLLAVMTKQLRSTILAAAKDGSAQAAPEAAQIFFAANASALSKANWTKSQAAFLTAYNNMFPKGSSAKLKDTVQLEAAYKTWLSTGMLDPSKPAALTAALDSLPSIAGGSATAMDNLRDAAESARIKLNSVRDILASIGGVTTPKRTDPGFSGVHPAPAPPRSAAQTGALNKTRGFASGGYKPSGESAWAGEYGPELLPRGMSGNITSTSKVRAMMGQLAQQAAAAVGRGGGDQHLYVDHMHITSPADKLSILEAVEFLAPAGR